MKSLSLAALALFLMSMSAHAGVTVRCSLKDAPDDAATFSIGADGLIQVLSRDDDMVTAKIADVSLEDSVLSGLEQVDEGDGEVELYIDEDGSTAAAWTTTADDQKISINVAAKSGAYEYRDIGSGAGDHTYALDCQSVE